MSARQEIRRGTLILVVGPSGAGKDTLISGARERLKGDPRFVFPRRVITRAGDAGGEEHVAVDAATFERMDRDGAFALSWSAHGFSYGIPASIEGDLIEGRNVVVNVSRTIVNEAFKRFGTCKFIGIVADEQSRRDRHIGRAREDEADIERRMERMNAEFQFGNGVHGVIMSNDGTIEEGVSYFTFLIGGISPL